MEIKKSDKMFYIGESEENNKAKIDFVIDDNGNIVIEHTIISDEFKGQGVGKLLVDKVVEFARTENKKIVPVCTYAKAQLEKNEGYQDVLNK